jgi:hypothetical protein
MSFRRVVSHGAAAVLIGIATAIPSTAAAQEPVVPTASKPARGWRLSPALGVAAEYDGNVFLLDSTGKGNVASPSVNEVVSGRYANMESATDLVTTLSAAFDVRGPGLSGRTLMVSPTIDYDLYARNSERSNAIVGISVEQNMPNKGRLRLKGSLTPSYFAKNYLADAVDGDGSGSITAGERIYARGEYRESELSLDFRLRLAASTKTHPFGATLQVGAGYGDRTYDPPFAVRDVSGPTAGANLRMALSQKVSLGVTYGFADFSGTPTDQVQLLDEPNFGQDFNGNGTSLDQNVRVVSLVDQSRHENSLGGEIGFVLGKRTALDMTYERRWRSFTSTEPLDVSHNGRQDTRNRLGARFGFGLGRAMGLNLGGTYTSQSTNRPSDPGATGEINDYTRYQAALGLTHTF